VVEEERGSCSECEVRFVVRASMEWGTIYGDLLIRTPWIAAALAPPPLLCPLLHENIFVHHLCTRDDMHKDENSCM
jgi:hypothetical protein